MQLDKAIRLSLFWRGCFFGAVLLLHIVFSRILQAELAGQIYFFTSVCSFLALLAGFHLEAAFTYFSANKQMNYNELGFFAVIYMLFSVSLLMSVLFIANSFFHFTSLFSQLNAIFYGIAYLVGVLSINYFSALFFAQKNYTTTNAILSVINFLLVFILLYLNISGEKSNDIIFIYFMFFLIQALVLVIAWYLKRNKTLPITLPSKSNIQALFKYSSVTLLANIVFFFVYKIDYWFVQNACSKADVGNYIQASKMGQLLLVIPQILASAVFPQTAANSNNKEIGDKLIVIFRLMLIVFLMLILLFSIVGADVFVWIFGDTYASMHWSFLILLPGIFALSMLSLLSAFLLGNGKTAMELKGAIAGLCGMVPLCIILIPNWGIIGAAIASIIGYFINFVYILNCFRKLHYFELSDLFKFERNDWRWLKGVLMYKKD